MKTTGDVTCQNLKPNSSSSPYDSNNNLIFTKSKPICKSTFHKNHFKGKSDANTKK